MREAAAAGVLGLVAELLLNSKELVVFSETLRPSGGTRLNLAAILSARVERTSKKEQKWMEEEV